MATPGATTRLRAVSAATGGILSVTGAGTFQVPDVWRVLWATQAGTPPQACGPRRSLERKVGLALLSDFVRSLPRNILGRFDRLPALAAKNTDEATHGMALPTRCFHDLV